MNTTQTKTAVLDISGRSGCSPAAAGAAKSPLAEAFTDPCEMNEQQFLFLQQLLTGKTGIRFRGRSHLSIKLGSRLRALRMKSFAQYIKLIKQDPGELPLAIEAVTTNETFFFRDFIHMVALQKYMATHLDASREFRIWSAASSSGEEAYSIAMTVHAWAATRGLPLYSIKIIGSDIDRAMLKRAAAGRYHRHQIERTPANYRAFLMRYLKKHDRDYFTVTPAIRNMVCFKRLNLKQSLPFNQTLDVIFCRNVFLYFSRELRNKIFTGLHRALKPGGLLVMGLCEPMPVDLPLGFDYTENSMYIKTEQQERRNKNPRFDL